MIPSVTRLVDELAAALPEARSSATPYLGTGATGSGNGATVPDATVPDATTWSRGGVAFAVLGADGIELRLDRHIAAAATRTPDAGPSPRGPEWVRFNPRELDGHAVDRLTAWYDLAYRRAKG